MDLGLLDKAFGKEDFAYFSSKVFLYISFNDFVSGSAC